MIADVYRTLNMDPSEAQLALAKLCVGEPLTHKGLETFKFCCPAQTYNRSYDEITAICGRKSGKTEYVAAPVAMEIAMREPQGGPGVVLIVAPHKQGQAAPLWSSIATKMRAYFPEAVEDIKDSDGEVVLRNGNTIKFASANFRTLRGPKYLAAIVDEAAFFVCDDPDEGGANPLQYVLDAISGGFIATDQPLMLLISSPWNKDGVLHAHWCDRAANPFRLVWKAPTLVMNDRANQRLMEQHRKDRGEAFYQREYMAEFGEDASAFIDAVDVDVAISNAPFFAPKAGIRYHMGLDPGRKRDHFGVAVAHKESEGIVIVDWCAEWKPGADGLKYASILPFVWERAREYRIRKIASDQIDFGGIEASIPRVNGVPEFVMERVMTGGNSGAELADVTRALFAQRKLVLPNQSGLAAEFKRLQDYLSAGGARDIRAKRGHDDRSRAIMLAIHQAFTQVSRKPWIATISLADDADSINGRRCAWAKIN